MRKILLLLTCLGAYFVPEFWPKETIIKQTEWVLREITYDSFLAWMLVLARRFMLISAPQYFAMWFLRPLAPRWTRKKVDAFAKFLGNLGKQISVWLKLRLSVLTSSAFTTTLSLTFSAGLFVVVYHYFDHYIVVIFGLWSFLKPIMIYGVRSLQHYLFRVLAFFHLNWLVRKFSSFVPEDLYNNISNKLHNTYMRSLRFQVALRFAAARKLKKNEG